MRGRVRRMANAPATRRRVRPAARFRARVTREPPHGRARSQCNGANAYASEETRGQVCAGPARRVRNVEGRGAGSDRCLVVAQFEMQAWNLLARTPVAPVQGVAAGEEQRARNDFASPTRKGNMRMGGERGAEVAEECQREGRCVAFLVEGVGVEVMHAAPFGVIERATVAEFAFDAVVLHLRAFAADSIAALVGQGAEEILEITPALRVAPLELPIRTRQPRVVECIDLDLAQEVDVQRRQPGLLGDFAQRPGEHAATPVGIGAGAAQQARSGHGRIGYRAQELRVVVAARALPCVGPCPIEHVLAVRVALDVQRGGADQLSAVVQRQVLCAPAERGADAAVAFQPCKESVGDERIVFRDQRVPRAGIDVFDGFVGPQRQHAGIVGQLPRWSAC